MKGFLQFIREDWSAKYKKSIDCSRPRGFSQRAHCAGRKKHSVNEAQEYTSAATSQSQVAKGFGVVAKHMGWVS